MTTRDSRLTRMAAAAALGLATALPAQALDLGDMTETEKAAFGDAVREYLVTNPEVMLEVFAVLEAREADAQASAERDMVAAYGQELFDDGRSWIGGNPEGDVTLVEFFDYRCGYCRKAFPEVEELIGTDGNIRMIIKEFPILGEDSVLAARFAIATRLEAGDEAYKSVHDAMMQMRGAVSIETLSGIGTRAGIDVDTVVARMEAPEVTAEIAANHQLAQALGISGTPTFVMGDAILRGYLPLEQMRRQVEAQRASSD